MNRCRLKLSTSFILINMAGIFSCTHLKSPTYSSNFSSGLTSPFELKQPSIVQKDENLDSSSPQFDWPVDEARFIRGYNKKRHRPHLGIDLAAPKGTPILSSIKGTVIYVGREFRGYGRMILIESQGGWATLYAHLDKAYVTQGQQVNQGEVIGAMGRTGRATGVHLHFEIRKNKGPVDPLVLLPNVSVASKSSISIDRSMIDETQNQQILIADEDL